MIIMVTGGSGFIGANFLNNFVPNYAQHQFINIDKLTYAANPLSLKAIEELPNYHFEQVSVTDNNLLNEVFERYNPDLVINFAAESHVDRSIAGPAEFVNTNILGTFNLLENCRKCWQGETNKLLLHVSTDEVYGTLGGVGYFTEETKYDPRSPYAASKASSDHLVKSYFHTYRVPVIITNCSNNYGPFQFPEKLIPLMIINALEGQPLPIYGQGLNVRDWLYVEDHCRAIWLTAEKGKPGETYNIGGNNEWQNIDLVNKLCEVLAEENGYSHDHYKKLITYVKDRPGHDFRYAIDSSKINGEIGWGPHESFESGLRKTVRWYLTNQEWVESVKTGEYKKWIAQNYNL